jgi:peptidoglycan hydrolase FlgJ
MDALSPLVTQAAAPVPSAAATTNLAATRKAAEDFESFFVSQSFENMFSGVGADQMFGGGSAETVYRSMLLQEYGKVTARNGGIGIADAVQKEMLRLQENKQ